MGALSSNLLDLLVFLLPGFVAAAVFHSLTPFPRGESFGRTVQALIFTIIIQSAVFVVESAALFAGRRWVVIGGWNDQVGVVWSVVLAVLFGLLAAGVSNRDSLHQVLRRIGITHQTSFASEWYGALCRGDSFIVLHLTGRRRLYGWPEEWPSTPEKGHFVIIQGEWLEEAGPIALPQDTRVLVSVNDVEMIELVRWQRENLGGPS